METGDGLLVRLSRPDQGYAPAALAALARAAGEHGNGAIEVTARGNLQLRGLSDRTVPGLAAAIARIGIPVPTGPAVECDPLAGIDPAIKRDPLPIATAIRTAIAAMPADLRLAPKLSIVIDGGGCLPLEALAADIRLAASAAGWAIALGGTGQSATPFAEITPDAAAAGVTRLIERIAAYGPAARARDILAAEGMAWFAPEDGMNQPEQPHEIRAPGADIHGPHPCTGGLVAIGIGLPFGHIAAEDLVALCRLSADAGAGDIRPCLGRALLVTGLTREAASGLNAQASRLGLIVDAADLRRRIAACAGAPACASAHIDTRAIAALIAANGGAALISAHTRPGDVHVSGCAKGCAHPGPSTLTLVGTAQGIAVIRNGTAAALPERHLAPAALPTWLAHA